MNLSLKSFLATGTLGQLRLWMSAQEVLEILGPPDLRIGNSCRYGAFVLNFDEEDEQNQKLTSIAWHSRLGEPHLPAGCVIEDWGISAAMKPPDVKAYLHHQAVKFVCRSQTVHYVPNYSYAESNTRTVPPETIRGFLGLLKARNKAAVVERMCIFNFFLPSEVCIGFIDEEFVRVEIDASMATPTP